MHLLQAILAVSLAGSVSINALPTVLKRAFPASQEDFDELHRASLLSAAAYSGCQGQAYDVTITHQIDNAATDTQGYIGYSTTYSRIAVVMRGSTTPMDLGNDIDVTPVTPVLSGVAFPPGTQVMNGVYSPWSSVHDEVITEVKTLIAQYPDYSLESTGHSLGGSLTYLSYIALAQNFPDKNITSNALAAFPMGNQVFADFGTSQDGLLRRGNNAGDGTPNLYAEIYEHYGIEFYGNGTAQSTVQCEGERDPQCSAGDGAYGPNLAHGFSFGVNMLGAGCG